VDRAKSLRLHIQLKFTVFADKLEKEHFGGARGIRNTLHRLRGGWRMAKRIHALEEIGINRLTAAVIVPRLADVYLGLLQNCDNYTQVELI